MLPTGGQHVGGERDDVKRTEKDRGRRTEKKDRRHEDLRPKNGLTHTHTLFRCRGRLSQGGWKVDALTVPRR
eukprot:6626780-Pyramimonas_sp.AAC.1